MDWVEWKRFSSSLYLLTSQIKRRSSLFTSKKRYRSSTSGLLKPTARRENRWCLPSQASPSMKLRFVLRWMTPMLLHSLRLRFPSLINPARTPLGLRELRLELVAQLSGRIISKERKSAWKTFSCLKSLAVVLSARSSSLKTSRRVRGRDIWRCFVDGLWVEEWFAMKVIKKQVIIQNGKFEHMKTEKAILEHVNFPFLVTLVYAF